MFGSVNKEGKVGDRLLKQLFCICSPFAFVSSPKRVIRWWDVEPELCAWLRTWLEELFSGIKRLLRKQSPSLPTVTLFAVLKGRQQKMWCLFQRSPKSTRERLRCRWKYAVLWPLLVTISSNSSFGLSELLTKAPAKSYSLQ